jgi:hypothetical protein
MTDPGKRQRCIDAITKWLRILIAPDQVVELRALKVRKHSRERTHTESGYFDTDHLHQMAEIAFDLTPVSRGIYFTLNPLKSDILARRANRVDWAEEGELTKDHHVLCRRWLLIDADPERDSLISSTNEEKAAAKETIQRIKEDLIREGWPAPILGDSGNGYHALYRIDLPADDGGTVQRILQALAANYNGPQVKIDTSVYNPARICKLPGTLARKGDDTRTRPHRWAKLLEVPKHG